MTGTFSSLGGAGGGMTVCVFARGAVDRCLAIWKDFFSILFWWRFLFVMTNIGFCRT